MRYLRGFKRVDFTRSHLLKIGWERTIVKNLEFFVESNNLYSTYWDSNGVMCFGYLPLVGYKRVKDRLYVAFDNDGSLYSLKYKDLDNSLGNALNMACISVKLYKGFYIYEFAFDSYFKPLEANIMTGYKQFLQDNRLLLNNFLSWDYKACPHRLISGGTGSGKTYFLLYLLQTFYANNFKLYVIDPKRASLLRWGQTLGLPSASEDADIVSILSSLKREMDNRYNESQNFEDVSLYFSQLTPIIIVFDEVAAFMGGSADKKIKERCMQYLKEIILKGREAQVYMILSLQKPMSDYISTDIRDQLGLRVAFGRMSTTGYEMMFGKEYKDISPRFSGKGEGLIYLEGETIKPFNYKAPRLDNPWKVRQ